MIKNIRLGIRFVAIASLCGSFFLYSCGPKEALPEATQCTIGAVTVNHFPLTDNGSQWDFSIINSDKLADLYFQIEVDTGVVYVSDDESSNVGEEDLPLLLLADDYVFPDLDQWYYISLYDKDGTSNDDLVGTLEFRPSDYKFSHPRFLELGDSTFGLELNLTWE